MTRACIARWISRESREAFERECDKPKHRNDLMAAGEFPERVTTLAKRSERNAQTLGAPSFLAFFGSDSGGEEFLR